jgi:hypothetical protein
MVNLVFAALFFTSTEHTVLFGFLHIQKSTSTPYIAILEGGEGKRRRRVGLGLSKNLK